MRKMLVADDTEINKSILYDIFASQYELIQTESSEAARRFADIITVCTDSVSEYLPDSIRIYPWCL